MLSQLLEHLPAEVRASSSGSNQFICDRIANEPVGCTGIMAKAWAAVVWMSARVGAGRSIVGGLGCPGALGVAVVGPW
jgi:hypothetical protein